MKVYVDASVVMGSVLKEPGGFRDTDWQEWEKAVASELLRVEGFRALDRFRLRGTFTSEELADQSVLLRSLLTGLEQVPLHAKVLERAATSMPTPLGTLDAIHLATALLWVEDHQETLTFLTHDRELALAARACGLDVKTSPD